MKLSDLYGLDTKIRDDDPIDLYNHAFIVVSGLPTRAEGLGTGLLERILIGLTEARTRWLDDGRGNTRLRAARAIRRARNASYGPLRAWRHADCASFAVPAGRVGRARDLADEFRRARGREPAVLQSAGTAGSARPGRSAPECR